MAYLPSNLHIYTTTTTFALHFLIILDFSMSTRGLHMVQAQGVVEISPVDPTILVGSDLTLTCRITHLGTALASDITWTHNGNSLPARSYRAVDDQRSVLLVEEAGFDAGGLYACSTIEQTQQVGNATQVNVGVLPSRAERLTCYCYDFFDVTCHWLPGSDTNPPTMYTLQHSYYKVIDWADCDDVQPSMRSCTVPNIHDITSFRVVSTNQLGNTTSDIVQFDHETQTVPYPPRNVKVESVANTRLNVTWDLPNKWRDFYFDHLLYKLEYYPEMIPTVVVQYPDTDSELTSDRRAYLPSQGSADAYTVYCIRVAAKLNIPNKATWSKWSPTICQRTQPAAPDAPVIASWTSEANSRKSSLRNVIIQWEPLPLPNQRGPIIGYNVTVVTDSDFPVFSLDASQTSVNIKGMQRNAEYTVAILSFNRAGPSPKQYLKIPVELTPEALSEGIVVVIGMLALFFILGVLAISWYCGKHLLKPAPSIHFIEPERFERVFDQPIHRAQTEREVFDEPFSHHRTQNGFLPNGLGSGGAHLLPLGVDNEEDPAGDYSKLREKPTDESVPLLCIHPFSNGGPPSATVHLAHYAKSTSKYASPSVDKDYGKLYVQIPDSPRPQQQQQAQQTRSDQPRLDSTDSGFGDNYSEGRAPSYPKLSTIQGIPEPDTDSDTSGSGEVYRQLSGDGQPDGDRLCQPPPPYGQPGVTPYTRLSSVQGLQPSRTATTFGNHKSGSL